MLYVYVYVLFAFLMYAALKGTSILHVSIIKVICKGYLG